MIDHVAHAERFWMHAVITGAADPLGERPDGDPQADDGPFTTARPLQQVLGFYRDQAVRSDQILAAAPLDAAPAGPVPPDLADEIHTVRDVVLHMIEEVARHAGHMDIARELLDGKTGLGPR
jgi:uncharacterized damage-inducible protein DinB